MLSPFLPPLFTLALLLLLSTLHHQTAESTGSVFIYADCSPSKFQPNTPYQSTLTSLLTSVTNSASNSTYNTFTNSDNTYGLYQCRNDMGPTDCSACVQSAVGQLSLVCALCYAASIQLEGCFVRYSNQNFLGQLETAVKYRKCSSDTSGDGEFLRRRDDVMGGLQGGTGFRVSSSGTVEGYAQCFGDLSDADCSECLREAVGQLGNACGPALAGDVYLAQCYARYWASGYYLQSSSDDSEDDIGKTVAIVAGILAGLSLIVVLLSFIRKAC